MILRRADGLVNGLGVISEVARDCGRAHCHSGGSARGRHFAESISMGAVRVHLVHMAKTTSITAGSANASMSTIHLAPDVEVEEIR